MGFGSFFKHIVAPVTKVLGPVGTAALLPAIPLTQVALNVVDVGFSKLGSFAAGPGTNVVPPNVPAPYHGESAPAIYYGAPTYNAPSYPDYFGGGKPWDYSTPSETFLTPQYQTSPAYLPQRQTSPAWEDLAYLALPFL